MSAEASAEHSALVERLARGMFMDWSVVGDDRFNENLWERTSEMMREDCRRDARAALDALKAAGFAVVELPKPTGVNGEDNLTWSKGAHYVEQDFRGDVTIADRFGVDREDLVDLAGKLLAADSAAGARS